jgi:Na+-transporting methylmalonyl-CoA/oxaloacetate decarboxylase gamma subunit
MIGLVVMFLVLGFIVFGIWCTGEQPRHEVAQRVLHERAERAIDEEAARARRAMNDAAGQPWRNLVD